MPRDDEPDERARSIRQRVPRTLADVDLGEAGGRVLLREVGEPLAAVGDPQSEILHRRVMTHEQHRGHVGGDAAQPIEEDVRVEGVQVGLDADLDLGAERGQHPAERLACSQGRRAQDELRMDALSAEVVPDPIGCPLTAGCERAILVAQTRIAPARLGVTQQPEAHRWSLARGRPPAQGGSTYPSAGSMTPVGHDI